MLNEYAYAIGKLYLPLTKLSTSLYISGLDW